MVMVIVMMMDIVMMYSIIIITIVTVINMVPRLTLALVHKMVVCPSGINNWDDRLINELVEVKVTMKVNLLRFPTL